MTTVIKIGDKVIWQPKALEGRKNPLAYMSCKVLALYDDAQGHPAAIIRYRQYYPAVGPFRFD